MTNLFPNNEHVVERVIRILIGVALLALVVVGPRSYWGLLGLVPLVTGVIGSCPLYTLIGISTRGPKRAAVCCGDARS